MRAIYFLGKVQKGLVITRSNALNFGLIIKYNKLSYFSNNCISNFQNNNNDTLLGQCVEGFKLREFHLNFYMYDNVLER